MANDDLFYSSELIWVPLSSFAECFHSISNFSINDLISVGFIYANEPSLEALISLISIGVRPSLKHRYN